VGHLEADSLRLDRDASITGDLFFNSLSNAGATVSGASHTPLTLPVLAMPAPQLPSVRPEAPDVAVGVGQTVELAAGDYGDVTVAEQGVLRLSGGVYHVRSLHGIVVAGGACAFPCRSFTFRSPSYLRIEGRFSERNAFVGRIRLPWRRWAQPESWSPCTHQRRRRPLTPPSPSRSAATAPCRPTSAANGTLALDQGTTATGAFLGRDVLVERDVMVAVASAFGNQAPFQPQVAFTMAQTHH
jgi:hypothetical protein